MHIWGRTRRTVTMAWSFLLFPCGGRIAGWDVTPFLILPRGIPSLAANGIFWGGGGLAITLDDSVMRVPGGESVNTLESGPSRQWICRPKGGSILRKATQAPGLVYSKDWGQWGAYVPESWKRWWICLWLDMEKACKWHFRRTLDLSDVGFLPASASYRERRRFRLILPSYLLFPIQEYVKFCRKDSKFFFIILFIFLGGGGFRSKSNQREGCSKTPQFRSVRSKKGDLIGYSSFLDQQLEEPNYECIQASCRQTYYMYAILWGYITDLNISTLTIHYQVWLDTPDLSIHFPHWNSPCIIQRFNFGAFFSSPS